MLTIHEIAKMAGVSVSAVSRYLNNGYISEEKSKEIERVIRETGYRPQKQAQILRTKKSKVIGVIVPKISSESVSQTVSGISISLEKKDYQMLLANTENNLKLEIDYLNLLKNNPVDGIIFIATMFTKQHEKVLAALNIPVVIVGQQYQNYSCVFHDDFSSAKELTTKMIQAGRKNLACICVTSEDKAAGLNRRMGFEAALQEHHLELSSARIAQAEFNMESGYEQMQRILHRDAQIDAVFCATDTIAVGAMQALTEAGKSIPRDVSVVGVGFSKLSRVVSPQLTTAQLHYKTSGLESADMLLRMIEDGTVLSKQIMLGYEIVSAQSV